MCLNEREGAPPCVLGPSGCRGQQAARLCGCSFLCRMGAGRGTHCMTEGREQRQNPAKAAADVGKRGGQSGPDFLAVG